MCVCVCVYIYIYIYIYTSERERARERERERESEKAVNMQYFSQIFAPGFAYIAFQEKKYFNMPKQTGLRLLLSKKVAIMNIFFFFSGVGGTFCG